MLTQLVKCIKDEREAICCDEKNQPEAADPLPHGDGPRHRARQPRGAARGRRHHHPAPAGGLPGRDCTKVPFKTFTLMKVSTSLGLVR